MYNNYQVDRNSVMTMLKIIDKYLNCFQIIFNELYEYETYNECSSVIIMLC